MIDATNAADSDAFLAAFADDATLVDWGYNGGGAFAFDVDGGLITRMVIPG